LTPAAAPKPWDLSCPDWRERIKAGRSLVPTLPLDHEAAARAVKIFDRLRLPDVPGTPTLGEAGGPWYREIVAAIFGSIDKASGRRMVRENLTVVPKKNSKTTNAAGVMLTAMLMNQRPRAEFLIVAPTQAIAEISFNQADGMVRADEDLASRFHVQSHIKKITHTGRVRSTLQVRTFDSSVLTGIKPVGVLVDELHELGKIADAERIIGQIRGGFIPFPEAFFLVITTQSDEPPAGAFLSELTIARMIRDGKTPANGLLPVLYEFPEDMIASGAWRDPAHWPMVTPNLDRSISLDRLIEDSNRATLAGEREFRRWASQHLNVQIGLALMSNAWPGAAHWEKNAEPALSLADLIARCEVITFGIDGGGLDDLLGAAAIGRERESPPLPQGCAKVADYLAGLLPELPPLEERPESRRWLHWAHAWCHASVLELRKDIAAKLRDFAADGDLTIVERVGDDVIGVADIVEVIKDAGLFPDTKAIGVDPAGIGEILEELARRGIDVTPEASFVIGIPQGWKLTGAIKTVERKLAGGDLRHGGSRLMNFCVGNAKVEPRGNAISITKQASGTAKIDPLMATFSASALMAMKPEADASSIFDRDDLDHHWSVPNVVAV
jgi:phage terminase large subunit-like protein